MEYVDSLNLEVESNVENTEKKEIHIDTKSKVSINEFSYESLPELQCQFLWLSEEFISPEKCAGYIETAEEKIKSDPLNRSAYHTIIAYLYTRPTFKVDYKKAEEHLKLAEQICSRSQESPSETAASAEEDQYEGMQIDCGSSSGSDTSAEVNQPVDEILDCKFIVDALRLWIRRQRGCPMRELSEEWFALHHKWTDAMRRASEKKQESSKGAQKTATEDAESERMLVHSWIVEALSYRHFGRKFLQKAAAVCRKANKLTGNKNLSALFGEANAVAIIRRDTRFIMKPNQYEIRLWALAYGLRPADPVTRCHFLASCAFALINFTAEESNGKEAEKIWAEIRRDGKQKTEDSHSGMEDDDESRPHLSYRLAKEAFSMKGEVDIESVKKAFDLCQRVFRNLGLTDNADEVKEALKDASKNYYMEADQLFTEAKELKGEKRHDEAKEKFAAAKSKLKELPDGQRNWMSEFLLIKIINLESKIDGDDNADFIERLYDESATRFSQKISVMAEVLVRKGHYQICFAKKPLEGWRTLYRAVELHPDCTHKFYPMEINYIESKVAAAKDEKNLDELQLAWFWQTFSIKTDESLAFWFLHHSPRPNEPKKRVETLFWRIETPNYLRNKINDRSDEWKYFKSQLKPKALMRIRQEFENVYEKALLNPDATEFSAEHGRFARFHLCRSLLDRKTEVPHDSKRYFLDLVNENASLPEKRVKAEWILTQILGQENELNIENLQEFVSLGCKDIFLKILDYLIKGKPKYPTTERYETDDPEQLDFRVPFSTAAYELCAKMLNCADSEDSGFYLQSLPLAVGEGGKQRIKSDAKFASYLKKQIEEFLGIEQSKRSVDRGVVMREMRLKLSRRALTAASKSAESSSQTAQFEIDLLKRAKEHLDGLVELLPTVDGKDATANYFHASRNDGLKLTNENWTVLQTPSRLEPVVEWIGKEKPLERKPEFSQEAREISHEEATQLAKTLFTKGKSLQQKANIKLTDDILSFLAQREAFTWRKQGAWLFLWTHYGNMVHRRNQMKASDYQEEIKTKLKNHGGPDSMYQMAQFALEFAEETQWIFEDWIKKNKIDH
uniref:Suf domain-containing protein n=2 Tax=Macrostomum lignano TaxID=282301 RepID=A0A1I8HQL3_9PLAT